MARGRGRKQAVGLGSGVSAGSDIQKRQPTKRKRTSNRSGELSPTQHTRQSSGACGRPKQAPLGSNPTEHGVVSPANYPEEHIATPPITQPKIPPCQHAESNGTRSKQVTNPEVLRFSDEETEDENAAVETNDIGQAKCILLGTGIPVSVDSASIKGLSSHDCVSEGNSVDSAGFNHYALHKSSSEISNDMLENSDEEPNTFPQVREGEEPNVADDVEVDPCLGRHFLHKENRMGFGLLDQQSTCPQLSSDNILTQPAYKLDDAMFSEDGMPVQLPTDSQDCRSRGLPYEAGTEVSGIECSRLTPCSSGHDTVAQTSSTRLDAALQPASQHRVELAEITNVVSKPTEVSGTVYRRRIINKGSVLEDGLCKKVNNNVDMENAVPGGLHGIFGQIFGTSSTQSGRSPTTAHGSTSPCIVGGRELPTPTNLFPVRHGAVGRGSGSLVSVFDSQDLILESFPSGHARPGGVLRRPTAARSTGVAQTVHFSESSVHLPQAGTKSVRHRNNTDCSPSAFAVMPIPRIASHPGSTEPLVQLLRSQGTVIPRTNGGLDPIISHNEYRTPVTGGVGSRVVLAETNPTTVSQEANPALNPQRATHTTFGGPTQSTGGRRRGQPSIPRGTGRGQTCTPARRECEQPSIHEGSGRWQPCTPGGSGQVQQSTPTGHTLLSTTSMETPHTNVDETTGMQAPIAASVVPSSQTAVSRTQRPTAHPIALDPANDLEAIPISANGTLNNPVAPSARQSHPRRSSRRGPPILRRGRQQALEVGVTTEGTTEEATTQPCSTGTIGGVGPISDISDLAGPTQNEAEMQANPVGESSRPTNPIPSSPIVSSADKAIERNKGKLRKRAYRARKKAEAAGIPPPGGDAVSVNARPTLSLCHGEPRDPWHDVLKKHLVVIIPLHVLCYRPMPSVTLDEHEAIYKALTGRYCNGNLLSPRWTKRQVSQLTQQRRTATRRKVKAALANATEAGENPMLHAGVFQAEMDFFIAQLADEDFLKYSKDMSQKSLDMLAVRGCANPMGQRGVSARKALHIGQDGDVPATIRDVLKWKEAAYNTYLNGSSKTAVARRLLNPTPSSNSAEGSFPEETDVQAAHQHVVTDGEVGPLSASAPLDPDWHDPFLGPAAYRREYILVYGREPTKADLIAWDESGRPPLE